MISPPSDQVRSISIETSGPIGSVAIALGAELVGERSFAATAGHGSNLLMLVDELVRTAGWRPADLKECYVSIGPGSFTGLRVAVSFARHLALAVGVRIVAVPTLEVIAWNLTRGQHVAGGPAVVMIEAKKDWVFAAAFDLSGGVVKALDETAIVGPHEYVERMRPTVVTGSGVRPFADAIRDRGIAIALESEWTPQAQGVLALGRAGALAGRYAASASMVPMYVRRPEAEELWEKRQASVLPPG